MKRTIFTLLISLLLVVFVNGQDSEPEKILNAAIYEEEINGNLEEAIRLYDEIVTEFPGYRSVVAEALYRNGLANEKLGNLKARQYYEKVINNYSDQPELVQLAQIRLNRILKKEKPADISDSEEITVTKLYSNPDFYGNSSYGGQFISNIDWSTCDLYYMDIKKKEKHYITTAGSWKEPDACADVSVWSFDNKKIAYNFSDDTGFHLFIYDVESNRSEKLISAFPDKYIGPIEWTRDGSHLLISRGDMDRSKHQLISVQNAETRDITLKDESISYIGLPTVSPGMKYILYHKKIDGKRKIYIYFLETGETKAVINDRFDNWGLKWEKEGNSFIFASNRSGSPALYRLKIQDGNPTGEPEMIYENINKRYKPLTLSDDGTLVFLSSTSLVQVKIADVDFKSGKIDNQKNLYGREKELSVHHVWSHDGKKIATVNNFPSPKVYIYDVESGKKEFIDLDFHVFDQGWNQWSGNDNEFMVVPRDMDYDKKAIINLSDKSVEIIKDVRWFAVFQGENNLIYTNDSKKDILLKNRSTGEVKTICSIENDDNYFFLKTSPNQKQLAFFEGNANIADWKNLNKLWVLTIETGQKELIWECKGDEYFGWGIIDWMADSENIFVFFGNDKTVSDGEQNDFNPYLIDINTKEKKKFGKILTQLNNSNRGNFHPNGNKFIYSTTKPITNIWLLENLEKKQLINW